MISANLVFKGNVYISLLFPDTSVTDICSNKEYSAESTYIASPNFPQNYPPKKQCDCVVTAENNDAKVGLHDYADNGFTL